MAKVMSVITISNDSDSDEEQEQELESKQQLRDKQLLVDTKTDEHDEAQEDDCIPYISRETVHGYLVRIIGHQEEYT